jgi:hypothetical protein
MQYILSTANDVLIDFDGNLAYLQNTALWTRDTNDTTVMHGYITTYESDLQQASMDKLLNYIDIDYIQDITIDVYCDGAKTQTLITTSSDSRTSERLYVYLHNRKAFKKIKLVFYTATAGAKLYGAELDITILKRRVK